MVDLIPEDYRREQRLRRLLRGFACGCILLVAAIVLARVGLSHRLDVEREGLARSRAEATRVAAERAGLAELTARRQALAARLQAFDALRARTAVARLLAAIDDAIDQRVWFDEIAYSSGAAAGMTGPAPMAPGGEPPARARRTPVAGSAASLDDGALLPSGDRVDIRGHALDHAALADLIRRLRAQPGIAEVGLRDTSARTYTTVQVIDFALAVGLASEPRTKP